MTSGSPAPKGRSTGTKVAVAVGVVAILAAAAFAITRLADGGSGAGGADSPEDAGLELLGALEDEDVLGMIDVLLPGERETFRDPATELVDELRRLDVLSDDASLDQVGGVDIVIDDEAVDEVATNVDDIVNVRLEGEISVSVDGESLPIGDLVYDNAPDADLSDADLVETDPVEFDVPLTAVEQDGRWYLSAFYSAAEQARAETDAGIPDEGVEPHGADSPEAAMEGMLDAVAAGDLEGMIAALNPQEFEALQRYAPAFLPDAQREIDAADFDAEIDAEYTLEGSGDTRFVSVESMSGSIEVDGQVVELEFADGCFTATDTSTGETIDSCTELDTAMDEELEPQAAELVDDLRDALDDYDDPGFVVKEVDGTWYVSPLATGAEQVLAFLRALDRDELDGMIADLADAMDDSGLPDLPVIPQEILEELDGATDEADFGGVEPDVEPDTSLEDDTDFTLPDLTSNVEDPWAVCMAEPDASAAASCFRDLVARGELDIAEAPAVVLFPECGLADVYWSGEYFGLPDDEFVATVEQAGPCFRDLVDRGEIDEVAVPLEVLRPECLEGLNRFVHADDAAYVERFYDCALG